VPRFRFMSRLLQADAPEFTSGEFHLQPTRPRHPRLYRLAEDRDLSGLSDQRRPMYTPEPAYQFRYDLGWHAHGPQPVLQDREKQTVLERAMTRVLTGRTSFTIDRAPRCEMPTLPVCGAAGSTPARSGSATTAHVNGGLRSQAEGEAPPELGYLCCPGFFRNWHSSR